MRFKKYLSYTAGSVLFLLTACTSGPTFYSDSYLAGVGEKQFSQMKAQIPISNDAHFINQLERVARPIARQVSHRLPNANWEFIVFDTDDLNAFAMPGGKVGVFRGLLELMESDDELAAVIGHEVAHVLLDHSNERMSAEALRGIGGIIATVGTKNMERDDRAKVMTAYAVGTQLGIMLPYSRYQETDADREGLILAAKAGFDPRAAITFWQKMKAASHSNTPEFLSTHPSHGKRIEKLRQMMPEAMRIYMVTKPQEPKM